jgi:hypothetical protein
MSVEPLNYHDLKFHVFSVANSSSNSLTKQLLEPLLTADAIITERRIDAGLQEEVSKPNSVVDFNFTGALVSRISTRLVSELWNVLKVCHFPFYNATMPSEHLSRW